MKNSVLIFASATALLSATVLISLGLSTLANEAPCQNQALKVGLINKSQDLFALFGAESPLTKEVLMVEDRCLKKGEVCNSINEVNLPICEEFDTEGRSGRLGPRAGGDACIRYSELEIKSYNCCPGLQCLAVGYNGRNTSFQCSEAVW